ncbi:hypothetical protein JCM10207_002903 [Rhodosporidiobolus poonsookiae]
MLPHDLEATPRTLSSTLGGLPESLGMPISPPSYAPSGAQLPQWRRRIMHERSEKKAAVQDGERRDDEGSPAHASRLEAAGKDGSGDLVMDALDGADVAECDTAMQDPSEPRRDDLCGEDVPLPLELDANHHPSRYSYGDFSSASSTTSSSASTSGFSSHSASSATTVSSTTTFSAAGWTGQACSPIPLQSILAVPDDACGDVEDADTPSAESCETAHPLALPEPFLSAPDATLTLSSISPATRDALSSATLARPPSPATSVSSTAITDSAATATVASDDRVLIPPENFAMVSPGLYRSSFPRRANFGFLRSLGLKSVMTLVQDPYPEENLEFLRSEGIQFFQFGIPGNKEPFVSIPEEKLVEAMAVALDTRNLPMLIHCNKGKHRTGCVVGCIRRLQSWSLTAIFEEYRRHSHPKSRAMDLQCIEAFGGLPKVRQAVAPDYLPIWAAPDPAPS